MASEKARKREKEKERKRKGEKKGAPTSSWRLMMMNEKWARLLLFFVAR